MNMPENHLILNKTNQLLQKMNYDSIGLMSGSSLDGLDIVLAAFEVADGRWKYKIKAASCTTFSNAWRSRLENAVHLDTEAYLLLHTAFGKYCGQQVVAFLNNRDVRRRPDVVGAHGHTTFHIPGKGMTHQLGDGAAIAAACRIPVVSDLRSVDVALGGQGAPIIPAGEKLLFPQYRYFMNIGGICNVSVHETKKITAFDVCPANRVLNMLAGLAGKKYDKEGRLAKSGTVNLPLLEKLNSEQFYTRLPPRSLANSFGTGVLYPTILKSRLSVKDALATYCEHIAMQTLKALIPYRKKKKTSLLVTGGGALNKYLVGRIRYYLEAIGIDIEVPDDDTVNYKEALTMALIGVLRLREQDNVFSSVTGAARNSCGGALWSVK